MKYDKLVDGVYDIYLELPYNRGYGVEGYSSSVSISVTNGDISDVYAYGYHDITEDVLEWDIEQEVLSDSQCIELLEAQCPEAFTDFTDEELKDQAAEAKFELYSGR